MSTTFNGIDQNCLLEGVTNNQNVVVRFTLGAAYEDFTGTSRYLIDTRVIAGTGYLGTNAANSSIFRSAITLDANDVNQSALDSTIGASGVEIDLNVPSAENDGTIKLFSRNNDVEYNKITTSQIDVYDSAGTTLLHSFDLTAPSSAIVNDSVGSAALTLAGFTFATGPTITGPDSTTEGAVTVQAGTLQDTIVTQSLISGSYSIEQTIDSATAGTLTYNAESGVNQCTPSTPVSGVPLEPTITAAGITPYVVQQEADDGTNSPATRNITLNPEATHEVIQTMAGVANTTPDQSIFGSTWVTVEDNHQARVPKVVDGVTFTWNDKGEFTTDIDKTVTFQYELFSPASGNWSAIDITVKSVQGVGVVVGSTRRFSITKPIQISIQDQTERRLQ